MIFKYLGINIVNKPSSLPGASGSPNDLAKIFSLIFIVLGSLSLLMLVIGGFRYTISGGDTEKMASAKKTIIYTIVGLIVSASAYIIVNAVLGQTTQGQ